MRSAFLACDDIESALGEGAVIKKELKGADLCGMDYEPLFDFAKTNTRAWYVVSDDYVTLDCSLYFDQNATQKYQNKSVYAMAFRLE